jgi:hypothetical protein
MLKIEVECMEDVLMAAIRDYCTEKLAGLKCPHHNCEVTLVLTNGPVEISVSNIETCCDGFRDAIIVGLRASQRCLRLSG